MTPCCLALLTRRQALKIYIQSRSAVLNDKAAILLQLEDFVERKSVLPEVADIDLYDEALESLLPNSHQAWADIIGELRWLCVKASPKNEELSLKCFQACLSRDDLAHAQQVEVLPDSLLCNPYSHTRAYLFRKVAF